MDDTGLLLLSFRIRWYGIAIVLGILLGTLQAVLRERRMGLPRNTALDLILIGVPLAIIGARAYYVLFSLDYYAKGPFWKVFAIWEGGLAFYGGLLGALSAGALYARIKRIPFSILLDLAAPGFAIGQAVGRWGNYFNQEAYGRFVETARLRFFPAAVCIAGRWHYATFFYESVWCLSIAIILLVADSFKAFARKGDCFLWYLYLYCIERGLVEGLRTDSLWAGSFRVSQLLSCLAALAIVISWMHRWRTASRIRRTTLPALVIINCILTVTGPSLYGLFVSILTILLTAFAYRNIGSDQQARIECRE